MIIIGAGVGGLCSAIYLLHAGFDVEIYEKNEQAGGVLAGVFLDGNRFDQTASIMIEFEEYTSFFSDVAKISKIIFKSISKMVYIPFSSQIKSRLFISTILQELMLVLKVISCIPCK